MGRLVAAVDHLHPDVAVIDQPGGKRSPRGVLRTIEVRCAARFQKILERVPSKLMREFKCLNQTLLFQVRKLALSRQPRSIRQLSERFLEILEPLSPAHI